MPVIAITGGSSIVLPADWNPANNSIECIGGGQGGEIGDISNSVSGGEGGSYASISNFGTPGQTLYLSIGTGSSGFGINANPGGDTYVNTSSAGAPISVSQGVLARGGGSANTSVGLVKNSGGLGGGPYNDGYQYFNGGGGGGAAGPLQPGGVGGNGGSTGGGAGGVSDPTTWTTSYSTAPTGTGLILLPSGTVVRPGNGGAGGFGIDPPDPGMAGYSYGGGGGCGGYNYYVGSYSEGGSGAGGIIILTYTIASANTGAMFSVF